MLNLGTCAVCDKRGEQVPVEPGNPAHEDFLRHLSEENLSPLCYECFKKLEEKELI